MLPLRKWTIYAASLTGVLLAIAAVPAVGVIATAIAGDDCGLSTCDDHGEYFQAFATPAMLLAMITGLLLVATMIQDAVCFFTARKGRSEK